MSCALGIDIGTSTIKVILIDKESGSIGSISQEAVEPLPSKHAEVSDISGARERRVEDIWCILCRVVRALDASKLQRVCAIGICGQMHGCILWNDGVKRLREAEDLALVPGSCSHLVTWQDGRCSGDFLSSLPATRQPVAVSAGYGCATLAWLQRHQPRVLEGFTRAGTIMDLVVWLLCSQEETSSARVLMSAQNATSWGYFDIKKMQWETSLLNGADFPVRLLPKVVPVPCLAGSLHTSWCGIPRGTPVCVGMGDLQCSFLAASPSTSDAVLNIGSASQLGVIKPAMSTASPDPSTSPGAMELPESVMEVPYFHSHTLLVAASLTGANILTTLVETLRGWMQELKLVTESIPSDQDLHTKLVSLAKTKLDTSLHVQVTLWGERYDTGLTGSVANVCPGNVSLGDVASASFRGIAENLRTMMPDEIFQSLKIRRLLGSGSALHRNPALQHHAETVFNLPLELRKQADAPLGAALAARELIDLSPERK